MATRGDTIEQILAEAGEAGSLSARKMFGKYCLYLDRKPVALICDDTLYVKITDAGRSLMPDADTDAPYPGGKPHFVVAFEGRGEEVAALLKATLDALPLAKTKKAARKIAPPSTKLSRSRRKNRKPMT